MARILITSALPYINGVKHLGNLVGSQLPADVYARFARARGHEVMFICATDEHGTPAELAAAAAGEPVADYCARLWRVQKDLADGFRLSFDHYRPLVERAQPPPDPALRRPARRGGPDRGARGAPGLQPRRRPLSARPLHRGHLPQLRLRARPRRPVRELHQAARPDRPDQPPLGDLGLTDLEVRQTKHLYLRQSALRDRLRAWIDGQTGWPILTTSIARKWLDDGEGLQDRGITRDLDWGIPVRRGSEPWPGMEGKVFYVWFDAPIEYIAATAEWADAQGLGEAAWRRWWRTDEGAQDVRYVQFMGKDNVPFHTLSFPATILGSGEPWKLVDYIKSFNYLNYEGGKFSTSQGRGIFMDQALAILPADYWRWWLIANVPESGDANFTWEGFQAGVNKDLADVLGNFVSRVTKFCRARFGEEVPEAGEYGAAEAAVTAELATRLAALERHLDAIDLRKAAQELRAIWVAGNEYLQAAAPWTAIKAEPDRAAATTRFALNLVRLYGIVSRPFLPDASDTILAAMASEDAPWPDDAASALAALPPGHAFRTPDVLFRKITDDERAAWASDFAGAAA
jgi:methionyl-tRNA synthetase